MQSIIQNYSILHEVWEHATEIVHDTETIAHIQGVASQMHSFDLFFGLALAESLLCHTDNSSRTLQTTCSAAEGKRAAEMTRKILLSTRSEECFDFFWEKVN